MNRVRTLGLCMLALAVAAPCAFAQDENGSTADAQTQNRLQALEEQMRNLQGELERANYQNQQLKAQMEKSNGDIQYRLQALESRQSAAPAPTPTSAPVTIVAPNNPPEDTSQLRPTEIPQSSDEFGAAESATPQFTTPRDHYNYALDLLNHAQYVKAGEQFAQFTHQYPHDPLIGNAYFWLGDTYYVRHDYIRAADNFRQGYEAMPTGPKAADNLLKLSMALSNLNKNKEACVVLKQVVEKFGSSATSTRSRAEQEMNRMGCD